MNTVKRDDHGRFSLQGRIINDGDVLTVILKDWSEEKVTVWMNEYGNPFFTVYSEKYGDVRLPLVKFFAKW